MARRAKRDEVDAAGDRDSMLRRLRAGGVDDRRVLAAMARVPREEFVTEGFETVAYADRALPIGYGQTISQPLMVAHMLQALSLRPGEIILDVGTGSGYQAAVLAEMGARVTTVERLRRLAEVAAHRFRRLGYDIEVIVGDGSTGAGGRAFDGIVCAAVAPREPPSLVAALAPGGRLVIPLRTRTGADDERLFRFRRPASGEGGRMRVEDLGACRFVPLLGREGYASDQPE